MEDSTKKTYKYDAPWLIAFSDLDSKQQPELFQSLRNSKIDDLGAKVIMSEPPYLRDYILRDHFGIGREPALLMVTDRSAKIYSWYNSAQFPTSEELADRIKDYRSGIED